MSAQTEAQPMRTGLTPSERSQLRDASPGSSSGGAMIALMQRELVSLFCSPIAYVVGFVFLVVAGYIFLTDTLQPGNEASLRSLFETMAYLLVFAVPILTMRSVAEEFSSGAIEMLMTAPITDAGVILGKFFGALLFYVALLATTVPYLILMFFYSKPAVSVAVVGYFGLFLLGALFIAVGIFASCCTKHQLLSAIIAIGILGIFTFGADRLAERGIGAASQQVDFFFRNVGAYSNVLGHFSDFSKGILDSGSVIFLISGTVFFLFLATKVLESRRWR